MQQPFPHRVFDDYLDAGLLSAVASSWPAPDWRGWEPPGPGGDPSRRSDLATPLPRAAGLALYRLAADALGPLVGRPFAVPDLSLWGGGLHEVLPGAGGLGCHLDASIGPRLGLRRAWSAVLWVHPRWAPSWGGELVLHGPDRLPVASIEPRPGRLALFACSDLSWHSVRPVRGMAPRRSLALFGYEEGPASPPVAGPGPGADLEGVGARQDLEGERTVNYVTYLGKRPDWARVYQFDFSDFDEWRAGQTLTGTPTVTASPSGLTVGSPVVSGRYVQVAVSGGSSEPGTAYVLTCTVSTSGGATLSQRGGIAMTA